jgi:hypothetical protein
MSDFVIEATNERGIVEQELVTVNQMALDLSHRRLVRIDGALARATKLEQLYVHPTNTYPFAHFSPICFVSALRQLLRRRARVCALHGAAEQTERAFSAVLFTVVTD